MQSCTVIGHEEATLVQQERKKAIAAIAANGVKEPCRVIGQDQTKLMQEERKKIIAAITAKGMKEAGMLTRRATTTTTTTTRTESQEQDDAVTTKSSSRTKVGDNYGFSSSHRRKLLGSSKQKIVPLREIITPSQEATGATTVIPAEVETILTPVPTAASTVSPPQPSTTVMNSTSALTARNATKSRINIEHEAGSELGGKKEAPVEAEASNAMEINLQPKLDEEPVRAPSEIPEVPEVPEQPGIPQPSKLLEVPEALKAPKVSEHPGVPEAPDLPGSTGTEPCSYSDSDSDLDPELGMEMWKVQTETLKKIEQLELELKLNGFKPKQEQVPESKPKSEPEPKRVLESRSGPLLELESGPKPWSELGSEPEQGLGPNPEPDPKSEPDQDWGIKLQIEPEMELESESQKASEVSVSIEYPDHEEAIELSLDSLQQQQYINEQHEREKMELLQQLQNAREESVYFLGLEKEHSTLKRSVTLMQQHFDKDKKHLMSELESARQEQEVLRQVAKEAARVVRIHQQLERDNKELKSELEATRAERDNLRQIVKDAGIIIAPPSRNHPCKTDTHLERNNNNDSGKEKNIDTLLTTTASCDSMHSIKTPQHHLDNIGALKGIKTPHHLDNKKVNSETLNANEELWIGKTGSGIAKTVPDDTMPCMWCCIS